VYETLEYEEADGVAWVTLNRPESYNAFDTRMQEELASCWAALRTNDDVRAVVLTGAGEKAFCTGIDRGEVPTDPEAYTYDPFTYEDPGLFIGPKTQRLWKPVIAAVNGLAGGGAFYLLGEADIIVAAEHATFFDPHVTYGMPAVFEPALMLRRMPFGDVMRMTLMGVHERISAQRAREMGLVSEVVPAAELRDLARHLATTIASAPAPAVQASVRSVWAARELTQRQYDDLGNALLALGVSTERLRDGQEVFKGERPKPRIL
jgi:enoyl-CoA hydratase/carnithine racemase